MKKKKTKTFPSAVFSQQGVLLKIKLYHVNTDTSTYFLHTHLALAVLENQKLAYESVQNISSNCYFFIIIIPRLGTGPAASASVRLDWSGVC